MLSAFRVCSNLRPTIFRTLSTNVKCYQSANVIKACQSKVLSPITLTEINCRLIHISGPKRTPVASVLYFPATMLVISVISGILLRSRWRRTIKKRHLHKIWAVIGVYLASVFVYLICNMEDVPITRRRRFMCVAPDKLSDVDQNLVEEMLDGKVILDLCHPAVQRVLNIAKRLIAANGDIKRMTEMEWTVSMVDVPGRNNAMVSGTGEIVVFKGMMDRCATDDELGIVLAHEMSHAILDHVPEKISNTYLVGFFTAPIMFLIWAFLPLFWALVLNIFLYMTIVYWAMLPCLRTLEEEADAVGLQLAARACIDVRQAVSFWKRLDHRRKLYIGSLKEKGSPSTAQPLPESLLLHPTHESRWRKMEALLEETLVLRDQCQCPALGPLPNDFGLKNVEKDKALQPGQL